MLNKIEFGNDPGISAARNKALQLISEFKQDKAIANPSSHYSKISKINVTRDLEFAVKKGAHLAQKNTSLCGPAAFSFVIARDRPDVYVRLILALYKEGKVTLGKLALESSRAAKMADITSSPISGIDWMIMSSIKSGYDNPGNKILDQIKGITWPKDMKKWLLDSGYKSVVENTNIILRKDLNNLLQAQNAYSHGYSVILFVNKFLFEQSGKTQKSWTPNHWVVLNSHIKIKKYNKLSKSHNPAVILSYALTKSLIQDMNDYEEAMDAHEENGGFKKPDKIDNQILLDVFTWGRRHVPVFNESSISKKPEISQFLKGYYGYIKAKQ